MAAHPIPEPPALTFFASLTVEVDDPITVGETLHGARKIIPIRGGTVTGDGWSGKLLDAGADFQLYPSPHVAELSAMYVIEAEDGTKIFVDNHAIRTGSAEDLEALVSGKEVDPARIYFRFAARLSTDASSPFAWVNSRVFVGSGTRQPDTVRLDFFAVD
ncbi:DUF3237 domain-containing protein [Gulosibacter molinativorax]|uniref:UPF0311 protein C7K25_12405 n=1 Tax=Gulosibacter molinativorax TaxID=256821 RepID=A0ABT7CAE8_9MICO|nr:DUF3237 domain-containing protein [Gulosibacter molinativorax]MDJ1372161.1 DUF3237 domain-containing protein [Gulosibacter molinativorax]QUY60968.1 Hypothetical protein GMOLON4_243 [Gulosibacter molinativorax]